MKMINSQKKGQVIWDADWESDYVCKKTINLWFADSSNLDSFAHTEIGQITDTLDQFGFGFI